MGHMFYYISLGLYDSGQRCGLQDLTSFTNGIWTAVQWGEPEHSGRRRLVKFYVDTSFGKQCISPNIKWNPDCLNDPDYPVSSANQIIDDGACPFNCEADGVLVVQDRGLIWTAKILIRRKWNGPILVFNPRDFDQLYYILQYVMDHSNDLAFNKVKFYVVTEEVQYRGKEADEFQNPYMWLSLHKYKQSNLVFHEVRKVEPGTPSVICEASDLLTGYLDRARAMVTDVVPAIVEDALAHPEATEAAIVQSPAEIAVVAEVVAEGPVVEPTLTPKTRLF